MPRPAFDHWVCPFPTLRRRLAWGTPLLPGAGAVTFIDVDSLLRRMYRKKKQGVGFGHVKVGERAYGPGIGHRPILWSGHSLSIEDCRRWSLVS